MNNRSLLAAVRRVCVVCIYCAAVTQQLAPLQAQPYCTVRTFSIHDGLAASIISGMAQTSDGLMWQTTWNGLNCYDGYNFTTFRNTPGQDQVLTTNRLLMIKPDTRGNLWCTTYDRRLYRFDTRQTRFVPFTFNVKGKEVDVRKIYNLENGHTWVVPEGNAGLFCINDENGQVVQAPACSHRPKCLVKKVLYDKPTGEWVFTAREVVSADGRQRSGVPLEYMQRVGDRLFFASTGAVLMTCKGGQFRRCQLPATVTSIHAIAPLGNHYLLIATNAGVLKLDVTLQRPTVQLSGPAAETIALSVDSRQRVWAFRSDGRITLIDGNGFNTLEPPAVNPMEQTTINGSFWHEDANGVVWTIPVGGTFCYYDEQAALLVPYVLRTPQMPGQALSNIYKYFIDRDGNLWLTGTRNLTLVNFKYHHIKYVPTQAGQEVRSVCVDDAGRVWAGMYGGQLMCFDRDRRLLGYLNPQGRLQAAPTTFSDKIYALFIDSRKRLWVGTKGDGLYLLSHLPTAAGHDAVHMRHFVAAAVPADKSAGADRYSLSHNDIYCIEEDSRQHVWVATFEQGLNLVDEQGDRLRFIHAGNDLRQYPVSTMGKVRRITHTPQGVVIVSTNNGLLTFSDSFDTPAGIKFFCSRHVQGDHQSLYSSDVLQTKVLRSGALFVSTQGGGVQRVTSDNLLTDNLRLEGVARYSYDEGMAQSLEEDSEGNLWIFREGSVNMLNVKTGDIVRYGPNDFSSETEFSEALPAYDPNSGAIVAAAMGGYLTFLPRDMHKNSHGAPIVFTGVMFQGDPEITPLPGADSLDVPANRRNLTVYFSALNYSDHYLVRYAYKLDGIDRDWNYVGSERSVSFNQLPHGHLRLLVKSTNADGQWTDDTAVLHIYAHPTFWETPWAWLIYALIATALCWLMLHIYNLRRRAQMERELNQMKTQFYTDVSHRLRTPLTLIGGPVDEVLHENRLTDTARSHLQMVSRNAKRMLDLVNKMLKYSMEHGVYISDDHLPPEVPAPLSAAPPSPTAAVPAPSSAVPPSPSAEESTKGKVRLLIVEDNADLRAFLSTILSGTYEVMEAENGKVGLEKAATLMPDFIITDVMMPEMDGLSMVHTIKQNPQLCHIPIIVLSAKASLDDRLQGLREGIDDYITKPFSATYLKQRVENIIGQRKMLQQVYLEGLTHTDYHLAPPKLVDADQQMMDRLMDYLENHIADAEMKIEDLAQAVHLGRSVFYGKVKSIVGMTPVDFVRHIRIERAEQLLSQSSHPVSQVAYMVGFSDPKYFSKCFKKETGLSPSDYRLNPAI